jgi:SOS response regulatory protein OraA/RecX
MEKMKDIKVSDSLTKEIIVASLKQLRDGLLSKKWNSQQLLKVFIERAVRIGTKHNYLADNNFANAFEMAKERDAEREDAFKKGTAD